jgi:chromosome segregation ATPase
MCYRLDDIDEAKDKGFLINKSQLIYHLTGGAVLPRKLHQFDDIKLILEKQNINKSEIDDIINLSNILNEVSHRRSLFDIDFSDDETDIDNDNNDENEDIEEAVDDNELNDIDVSNVNEKLQTLSAAVKQIKDEYLTKQLELTHQIQQLERQVKRLQAEKNAIQEKTENEHQELVDLRNLVFNSQDEEAEKEEKYDSPIEFPYSVKHNISVFGGHETWRKSIKTMFNNVRFISKDIKPNQDIIKNSNIIWIQANAMSHSYYYAVIDIARANNVSVRYFSYASARKCAEQIVMNDLKN